MVAGTNAVMAWWKALGSGNLLKSWLSGRSRRRGRREREREGERNEELANEMYLLPGRAHSDLPSYQALSPKNKSVYISQVIRSPSKSLVYDHMKALGVLSV